MAALNLSTNGQSIQRSYQAIVDAPAPTSAAASSGSYGQWAVFSVAAPLASAFQDTGGKESVLKVQGSGEGDLNELIDEFSDGRIQFAFLKVKDPNTSLPKIALIGWCGEGVPERTKGYFTSHLSAVSKVLTGYHVQITARSDRDLTPEGIMQKVSDASGSRYTGGGDVTAAPPPKPPTKPVFMPTQSSGGGGFNPRGGARRTPIARDTNVDADGWGADAPQVTRSQLEKVPSAYQPTKVDMRALSSQSQTSTSTGQIEATASAAAERSDIVKGGYQPVGKVDLAALRREAASSSTIDNRPEPVKGTYEPVGKVDIAAIKARARQEPLSDLPSTPQSRNETASSPPPVASRAAAFTSGAAPLTSLPKPKIANRFGGSSTFTGTKAPLPGGPGATPSQPAPVAGASRTFADQGGKTPAQIWAEKKGKVAPPPIGGPKSPIASQTSGGGGWGSSYTGKKWGSVQTTRTGQSAASGGNAEDIESRDEALPTGRVGALAEALGSPPGISGPGSTGPPPLETSTKPGVGAPARALPVPPPQTQPRTPTPEPEEEEEVEPEVSPIRVAMPVSHTAEPEIEDAHEEQFSPPPAMPIRSLARESAQHDEEQPEEEPEPDSARSAGAAVAGTTFGQEAAAAAPSHTEASASQRAVVLYDYEAAEDNEITLVEGKMVMEIEQVDPDWWKGRNEHGDEGLFPSNYVELVAEGHESVGAPGTVQHEDHHEQGPAEGQGHGSATALYDYEAAEDNELTFPEGAIITDVEFPDADWWAGTYEGQQGLFPANYVQLHE